MKVARGENEMKVIEAVGMLEEKKVRLKEEIEVLKKEGKEVGLTIISASEDKASQRYIENKVKLGKELGIEVSVESYGESVSTEDLVSRVKELGERGVPVILQLPVYAHIEEEKVMKEIKDSIDADGFQEGSLGRVMRGEEGVIPATPKGVMSLLEYEGVELEGKVMLVIGRSLHVGKTLSVLGINKGATVIVANSKTKNLGELTKQADIVVSCVGKIGVLSGCEAKEGSIWIGVGFEYIGGKQMLDFDIEELREEGKVSKVSNRVRCTGVATVISLMENVIELSKRR